MNESHQLSHSHLSPGTQPCTLSSPRSSTLPALTPHCTRSCSWAQFLDQLTVLEEMLTCRRLEVIRCTRYQGSKPQTLAWILSQYIYSSRNLFLSLMKSSFPNDIQGIGFICQIWNYHLTLNEHNSIMGKELPGTRFTSQQPMELPCASAKAEEHPRRRIDAESSILPFSRRFCVVECGGTAPPTQLPPRGIQQAK